MTVARLVSLALTLTILGGCGGGDGRYSDKYDSAPAGYPDVSNTPDAIPRVERISRASLRSYTVFGHRYHPMKSSQGFVQQGVASWYGKKFHGNQTANGEIYDMYAMTAAHKRLPLPSYVQVRNLTNGKTIVVRVNDRGPFHGNRVIDLSYAAASKLGVLSKGTALVEVRAIDPRNPQAINDGASPSKTVTASSRIYIQVGSFGVANNAHRLQRRLQNRLKRAVRIEAAENGHGTVHRVQIGPLASVEIADQVIDRLEDLRIYNTQLLIR